jgi:anthranilate synthase component 2
MILLIDNYDSFTYNIYQYLSELGATVKVIRNDKTTLTEIKAMQPEKIVISPGPCTPKESGISSSVIREFGHDIAILGICLGHQCIGDAYGGKIVGADEIMHGKTSLIHHDGQGVFFGLPNPFNAIRYHSLIIKEDDLPADLEVSAWTENNMIMGVRHKVHPVEGIQFHPESIMTENGKQLLANFIG